MECVIVVCGIVSSVLYRIREFIFIIHVPWVFIFVLKNHVYTKHRTKISFVEISHAMRFREIAIIIDYRLRSKRNVSM